MGSRYLFIVLYVFLEHHLSRGDYRRDWVTRHLARNPVPHIADPAAWLAAEQAHENTFALALAWAALLQQYRDERSRIDATAPHPILGARPFLTSKNSRSADERTSPCPCATRCAP